MTHRRIWVAAALALLLGSPRASEAQMRWRDLVITAGGSVEAYAGDLPAVTVLIVDSARNVTATVAELGVRGSLVLLSRGGRTLDLDFDSGLRQTAALGFFFRDYAPREWVGSTSIRFAQRLGSWGSLSARGGARERAVRDRPPMPLFVQPAYQSLQGSLALVTRSFDGVSFDASGDLEHANYAAPEYLPQLNLLDRTSRGLELGARWGAASTMRFFGGVRWTEYGNQPSYDPADPFRRDRTVRVGVEWTYTGMVSVQTGLEGALNRSNGNRPEYDALSFRALFIAPLPEELSLSMYAVLTGKSYVSETNFARLVPGEEADNASIAYLQIGRPLATNLDGAIRFGWTRAETDLGSAYYERFGGSVQLNYRPLGN